MAPWHGCPHPEARNGGAGIHGRATHPKWERCARVIPVRAIRAISPACRACNRASGIGGGAASRCACLRGPDAPRAPSTIGEGRFHRSARPMPGQSVASTARRAAHAIPDAPGASRPWSTGDTRRGSVRHVEEGPDARTGAALLYSRRVGARPHRYLLGRIEPSHRGIRTASCGRAAATFHIPTGGRSIEVLNRLGSTPDAAGNPARAWQEQPGEDRNRGASGAQSHRR